MQSSNQQMPCPVQGCNGNISFNTYKLLEGAKFECPNCNGQIGLAPDSRNQVKKTMTEFEAMRQQMLKNKDGLSNQ